MIFAIALIVIIPGVLTSNDNVQMSIKEILTSSLGFIIVVSLLVIGLRNGIKRVRKGKIIEIIDYDKDLNINLTGKIEYNDYRNLILGLSFKKPIYLVVLGIMILFALTFLDNRERMMNQINSNYFIFIVIGVFILSPILTTIRIKKLYRINKIFQEQLNYRLNNDSIHIKGNTVDSTQKWTHFYKIKETKNFLMLYHSKLVATLLEKKMFTENELNEFKRFINSLNVKRD